jgi:prevent-host-death family protein
MKAQCSTIDATTLRRDLAKVLGEVAYRGTRFTITKNGKVIAELSPSTSEAEDKVRRSKVRR